MHTHYIVFIHMKELELQFPIRIKICQTLDSRFQWSNNFLAKTPCYFTEAKQNMLPFPNMLYNHVEEGIHLVGFLLCFCSQMHVLICPSNTLNI